jgi:cytochrome c-type biogenesis protein CcsB
MAFTLAFIKNSLDNIVFLLLLIGLLGYWISITFSSIKLASTVAFYSVLAANVILTIILGWRWVENGYFPLSNLYESLLFFTWGLTIISTILEIKTGLILIGSIVTPLALFVVGFASLSLPDGMQKASPLVPALKSNWLMMHVSIMMISYSTLIIGSLLSILFLVLTKGKNINLQGSSTGILTFDSTITADPDEKRLNLLESMDNLSYRIIGLGFPLLTIGIISGAVWANEAWGSYWSWDPKETWALITWLVFAAYLHTRITKSWQGKGPALLASLGFVVVWICYLGVNFLGKGLHSYGWIL